MGLTWFYLVFLCSIGFLLDLTGFYLVLLCSTGFLPGFTGLYLVLPSFTGFYRLLPGLTWPLPPQAAPTEFYRVLFFCFITMYRPFMAGLIRCLETVGSSTLFRVADWSKPSFT